MLIRAALAALNVTVNVVALNNALPMSCMMGMMSNGSMMGTGMAGGDASACDPSTTNSSIWQRPLGKEGAYVLQDGGDAPLWSELGGHDDLLVYDCEGRLVDFLCSAKQCPGANDTDPREAAGRDRVVGAVHSAMAVPTFCGSDLVFRGACAALHPERVIVDATPYLTPAWRGGVPSWIVVVLVLIAAAAARKRDCPSRAPGSAGSGFARVPAHDDVDDDDDGGDPWDDSEPEAGDVEMRTARQ